jgi:glycolate oxidase FAD binding subunit
VDLIHPHSPDAAATTLAEASRDGVRVLVVGGRTQMDRGNPAEVDAELWTTLLDRVIAYEPDEMIAVAEAGVRLGDLRRTLADGGQEWPVDADDDATVGGVVAAGADSVRQLRVGLLRDSVVETEAVTGDGRRIRSGARVVKNVTGFDLHRLLTGSLGTLACITQVAVKVRPLPKATRTLVTLEGGVDLGQRLLDEVPGLAAVLAEPDHIRVRLEGWPEEVDAQTAAVRGIATAAVDDGPFPPPLFPQAKVVLEAGVVPSGLAPLLHDRSRYRALIGVGAAWVPFDDADGLDRFRARVTGLGGIAPAVRGPAGLGPALLPAADVQRRVKAAFDPAGILAPGRGWADVVG